MTPASAGPTAPRITPLKAVAFTLVLVLGLLLAIEGLVRAYLFVRTLGVQEEVRGYVVDDREAGYALRPGYSGGGIRVNSLGFRGGEVARSKPPGVYRIVALGDSATFGPHEEECAYPFALPGLLAREGRVVENVNAALEGYRTDRALAHLKKDVLPLSPDLVTVFIGWNDLYQTDPAMETEQISIRGNPLAQLLTMSEAAQTFRRVYFLRFNSQRANTGASIGNPALLRGYQPEGYATRLRDLFRTARSGGADVVAFTWPTVLAERMSAEGIAKVHYPWYTQQLGELRALYERYQETLRTVAREEGVPVVDMAALFDARGDKAPLFKDTAHFTCEGQQMIARHLADQILGGVAPSFRR